MKLQMITEKGSVISLADLQMLLKHLCSEKGAHFLLCNKPERIHTLIPGLLILMDIMQHCHCSYLLVSRYGIREGYLMKIMKTMAKV